MPAIPARGLLRTKYGGTAIAVERGRVEPSKAEQDLCKAENSLVPSTCSIAKKLPRHRARGVAPVGSFRSLRPRQETWFRAGTQDWAITTLDPLESSCYTQGSTVTHVHQNPDRTRALHIYRTRSWAVES